MPSAPESFAVKLAECIHRFGGRPPSDDCVTWARMAIADTIGVALAGAVTDAARAVRAVTAPGNENGGNGTAHVIGTAQRTAPLPAALINGTTAHALDFDDMTESMMGHPSVAVLPAALALADAGHGDGETLLRAYLTGFETASKLGRGMTHDHIKQGWHSTGTLGVFGAAAACSVLLRLNVEQIATALAIACSHASGVRGNYGTMTKPLHAGLAGRNGLFAALLAREGFTANPDAFEHPQGFFAVYNAGRSTEPEAALENWFDPPEILDPGVCLKLYPCGAHTHPFIEMVRALVTEHDLQLDDIERIDALSEQSRHNHTSRPHPRGGLDGKFSLQYTMARTLADGAPRLDHFTDAAVEEPRVKEAMALIHAAAHPDLDESWADKYGGEVIVHHKNGAPVRARIEHQIARGPQTPLSEAELRGKFLDCARRCLDESRAAALFDELMSIENCTDLSALMAKTAPAS